MVIIMQRNNKLIDPSVCMGFIISQELNAFGGSLLNKHCSEPDGTALIKVLRLETNQLTH